MLPLRTILYPTDFSERSQYALHLACSLARDYGAQLLVLYVAPAPRFHGEIVARRQEDGFAEGLVEQLRQLLPSEPGVRVEYLVKEGDAVAEILSVAEEWDCNLIVLGTHGRTGLGRLLMGSVAEQVVRRAPCPVLTVRMPLPEPEAVAASASPKPATV